MTKYYIDCEFDGHSGELLSLAMVRDGDTLIGHRLGPVKGVENQKRDGAVDGDNQQQRCRKKEG